MEEAAQLSLFEDFDIWEKKQYEQFKLKTDKDVIKFLKQITVLEEDWCTPYKHKAGYYNKKSHYINGRKVNRQVFAYIKKWFEENC